MNESPHLNGPTIDGHADTPQRFLDDGWNFTDPLGRGMLNLETARCGGLDAQFFAIWVDPVEYAGLYAHRALQLIDSVHEQVRRAPAQLAFCASAEELEQAHRVGLFAVLLGLEGGHCIENDLALLRTYHRLGCRYMTLTWSHSVGWADSCGDIDDPQVLHAHGLNDFGREVIREMNRLGMMVDISHVSDETFWAVLDTSTAPVIASHSSARALTDVPRNLTDDQIRAIARAGGIVMINFYPGFVDGRWRDAWDSLKEERDRAHAIAAAPFRERGQPVPFSISNTIDREFANRIPRAPRRVVVDHIEHILHVAGSEHVGLGSDFDGIPISPAGLDSPADLPALARELQHRGFSAVEIEGVLGKNLLRVWRSIEQKANAAAAQPTLAVPVL